MSYLLNIRDVTTVIFDSYRKKGNKLTIQLNKKCLDIAEKQSVNIEEQEINKSTSNKFMSIITDDPTKEDAPDFKKYDQKL